MCANVGYTNKLKCCARNVMLMQYSKIWIIFNDFFWKTAKKVFFLYQIVIYESEDIDANHHHL